MSYVAASDNHGSVWGRGGNRSTPKVATRTPINVSYLCDDHSTFGWFTTDRAYKANTKLATASTTIAPGRNSGLCKLITTVNASDSEIAEYTNLFNSWINRFNDYEEKHEQSRKSNAAGALWTYKWTIKSTVGFVSASACASNVKFARAKVCYILFNECVPKAQMESDRLKESVQGVATQESSKENSTIITRDEGITVSKVADVLSIDNYISSEPSSSFNQATKRWMPMVPVSVTVNDPMGKILKSYYLPESLIQESMHAINNMPFAHYIYADLYIVMKFVVNANRFHCGKIICSVKFDSYQADAGSNSYQAALSRPHVILDLATNNEGELHIPFRFRRGFVRTAYNPRSALGVRPSKYASVYIQILSPLRTGEGGPSNIDIRPFFMYKEAKFYGLSHSVAVQMENLIGSVVAPIAQQGLRGLLREAESLLKPSGPKRNMDKPSDLRASIIVPHARMNFANGKGLADTQVLRMDPSAMTSSNVVRSFPDEPVTTLDIARIWGTRSGFKWNSNATSQQRIFDLVVDPSTRSYDRDSADAVSPLEYVVGMYNFWSGPIEMRFDFISNSFHTGAVIIAVSFGRPLTADIAMDSEEASCYTKTFHLGEQKSVHITIPFIYDTPWRRSNTMPYTPINDFLGGTDDMKKNALSIRAESKTRVTVRVLNELRPPPAVAQEIDVLVFWRASKSFGVHSLKQTGNIVVKTGYDETPWFDSFPKDDYKIADDKPRKTRTTGDEDENPHVDYDRENLPSTIKTQMDDGSKEDEDPTADFSTGVPNLTVQTTDDQTNIKDILRRPTLMVMDAAVVGYSTTKCSSFFLPICPPSKELQWHPNMRYNFMNGLVGQTPQAALMNLFRFWRGSSRYTIFVVTDTPLEPVYITHVPHSGVRIFGNHQPNAQGSDRNPIFGCGLSTTVCIPSVNPSIQVEVPFDSENLWCLTFEDDAQRNYAWRDKGDTVAGHIAISCRKPCEVSIWWGAGDDFEFANYYGPPGTQQNHWAYTYNDNHARIQMESMHHFSACGVSDSRSLTALSRIYTQMDTGNETGTTRTQQLISGAKQMCSNIPKSALVKGVLTNIPYVGPTVAATEAYRLSQKADQAIENVTGMCDKVGSLADTVQAQVNEIPELVEYVRCAITQAIAGVTSATQYAIDFAALIRDLVLDLTIAVIDRSWTAVGVGIVRILTKVCSYDWGESCINFGRQIGTYLSQLMSPTIVAQGDEEYRVVGILASLLGLIFRVKINRKPYENLFTSVVKSMTDSSTFSYLNNVIRFVETTFKCVREMVLDTLGYLNPETMALKMLCNNSDVIDRFVTESQILLQESNSSQMTNPAFRTRFWMNVMQAYQIQNALTKVEGTVAKPQLSRMCNDVIKAAQEKFVDLSCSPVRYVPFVLCLTGKPGIGKSYITEALATAMMKKINYKAPASGYTYTRAAGSRYCNGYRDQPIWVRDDWLNMRDPELVNEEVNELFQLKSTCIFMPEMADLADKRIKGNPLAVFLMCNNAFPNHIANAAQSVEAVYRRRDLVVEASLAPGYDVARVKELTPEESQSFAHLRFRLHKDPLNPRANYHPGYKTWQEFLPWYLATYERYHIKELSEMQNRIRHFQQDLCGLPVSQVNFGDPFEVFYHCQSQIVDRTPPQLQWCPSDQLEAAVRQITNSVSSTLTEIPIVCVPEKPDNIFTQGDSLISGFPLMVACALVNNPTAMKAIYNFTANCAAKIVAKLERSCMFPERDCIVCHTNKPCANVCKSSLDCASPHFICSDCWIRWRTEAHCCPLCRAPDVVIAFNQLGSRLWSVLGWLAMKVGSASVAFWRECARAMGSKYFHLMHLIGTMGNILNYSLYGIVPVCELLSLGITYVAPAACETYYECRELLSQPRGSTALVQSDDWDDHAIPDQYAASRIKEQDVDPLFKVEVRGDLVEDYTTTLFTVLPRCYHHDLVDQLHTAVFLPMKEGFDHWRIVVKLHGKDEYVRVSDTACHYDDCCFHDSETVSNFFAKYATKHLQQIRSHQQGFVNEPQNREMHRQRIPRLLRPDWISPREHVLNKGNWWDFLCDKYAAYKRLIHFSLFACATLGAVVISFRYLRPVHDVVQGPGGLYEAGATRHIRSGYKPIRVRNQKHAMIQSEEQDDFLKGQILKNYVALRVSRDGQLERLLVATGIFGNYALIPKHYKEALARYSAEGCKVELTPANFLVQESEYMKLPYQYSELDFVEHPDTDLALMKMPRNYPLFRDIRKFFALDKDLESPIANEGCLLLVPTRSRRYFETRAIEIIGCRSMIYAAVPDGSIMETRDVLVYDYSAAGACGSIAMVDNHTRPLRSMHTAGSEHEGYGVLITQELIETLVPIGGVVQFEDVTLESVSEHDDAIVLDETCQLEYIGVVPRSEASHIPKKSKIRPSLIAGVNRLKSTSEPAILDKTDPRYTHPMSPLYYGIAKHGVLTDNFPSHVLNNVTQALWDGWLMNMRASVVPCRRLSPEEAVVGLPGIAFYDPMKLNTSAGYPWTILGRPNTTKERWIKPIRDENEQMINCEIDSQLLFEILRKEALRRDGIVPHTVFADTLKDERRKPEKARKQGGTRVFCASPIDYTIAMRQNILHFCAAFMSNRFKVMSGVGINAKGPEWTSLVTYLAEVSTTNIVTLDYSNFGPGFNAQVAKVACDLICQWSLMNVDGINELELQALLYEITNSRHIAFNTVYQQFSGSPSGASCTTIINSLVNILYIMVAWHELMKSFFSAHLDLWMMFKQHVRLVVYGDDLIMSVSDTIRDEFNTRTIQKFFSDYGIAATSADKLSEVVAYQSLLQQTFLKRSFAPHPVHRGMWLSPLNWDSINDATQWIWSCADKKTATYENCISALIEAHGHGPDRFHAFKNQVNQALSKKRIPTITLQWNELDCKWFTGTLDTAPWVEEG